MEVENGLQSIGTFKKEAARVVNPDSPLARSRFPARPLVLLTGTVRTLQGLLQCYRVVDYKQIVGRLGCLSQLEKPKQPRIHSHTISTRGGSVSRAVMNRSLPLGGRTTPEPEPPRPRHRMGQNNFLTSFGRLAFGRVGRWVRVVALRGVGQRAIPKVKTPAQE